MQSFFYFHWLPALLLWLGPTLVLAQMPFLFTVKDQISNLNTPAKIYLIRGVEATDFATFRNGAFELKGTSDVPHAVDLLMKRDGKLGDGVFGPIKYVRVFVKPTPIIVTGPDSLQNARVTGGPVTADYQRLKPATRLITARINSFGAEAKKASAEERKYPELTARKQAQFDAITKEYALSDRDFIKANPNSWVNLYALVGLGMMAAPQYAVVRPLYEALGPALKNSLEGRRYDALVRGLEDVAVGALAPNFAQQTPDGKTVSLSDYRGKYALVDFWAS